ncbi:hypothetical protein RclHR1_05830012 [Rhizophagus clarus]|uniref:Uncharacterized protein n=1 Tax=Rhizophagus clarus TaxID=94130 RepID=A0A2Z6RQ42_9GLOM|nr:hypothetical protein RclHR1_05830012 [Rhizophagus clarus]
MEKKLSDKVFEIGNNEHIESESEVEFSCKISINSIDNTLQEIGKKIVETIGFADVYYYIYHKAYQSENNYTMWYYCSQNCTLAKRPCKHENQDKQRDRESIIYLKHDLLHKRPDRFGLNDTIKEEIKRNIHLTPSDIFKQLEQQHPNVTQKQFHTWWSYFIKKTYVRDNDQLLSAKILLHEYNYELLYQSSEVGIQYFGFITPFFNILKANKEIIVDATYKTNALGFELHAVIGQLDGAGSSSANENFSFIDIEFYPSYVVNQGKKSNFIFCSKDLRQNVISLLEKHFHLHPLIPDINGNFLSSDEIWEVSVKEMYDFCFTNNLRNVWAYLWSYWYEKKNVYSVGMIISYNGDLYFSNYYVNGILLESCET